MCRGSSIRRPSASAGRARSSRSTPKEQLVKVARAENRIQAEFIEGLLLEEGIPCVLSGLIGGYAPVVDPRDVMVPESGAQAAREALAWDEPGDRPPAPV